MMIYLAFWPKNLSWHSPSRTVPLVIAMNILVVWMLGSVLLSKPAVYLAAYAIHVTIFLPIGIFALARLRVSPYSQVLVSWLLIFLNLVLSPQFLGSVLGAQNYAQLSSSQDVERKLQAAGDIERIVGEISLGTKILVDSHSIFPESSIQTETEIRMAYGNLAVILGSGSRNPDFTYIVLDANSYYGQPNVDEEKIRQTLRSEGTYGLSRYDRIYSENGTELYVTN